MSNLYFSSAADFAAYHGHATAEDAVVFGYAVHLSDHAFAKVAQANNILLYPYGGGAHNVIHLGAESALANPSNIHIDAQRSQVALVGSAESGLVSYTLANPGLKSVVDMDTPGTVACNGGGNITVRNIGDAVVTLDVSGPYGPSDFAGVHGSFALQVNSLSFVTLDDSAARHLGASATHPLHIVMVGALESVDASAMHWGVSALLENYADSFIGGHGNDTITTSGGSVTLGGGDDLVILNADAPGLYIHDFRPGHDVVDISAFAASVADFATLKANATNMNGNHDVRIVLGDASLFLFGTNIAHLHASDFIFGH